MSLELQEDNIDALFEDLDDAGDFSVPAPVSHSTLRQLEGCARIAF